MYLKPFKKKILKRGKKKTLIRRRRLLWVASGADTGREYRTSRDVRRVASLGTAFIDLVIDPGRVAFKSVRVINDPNRTFMNCLRDNEANSNWVDWLQFGMRRQLIN